MEGGFWEKVKAERKWVPTKTVMEVLGCPPQSSEAERPCRVVLDRGGSWEVLFTHSDPVVGGR